MPLGFSAAGPSCGGGGEVRLAGTMPPEPEKWVPLGFLWLRLFENRFQCLFELFCFPVVLPLPDAVVVGWHSPLPLPSCSFTVALGQASALPIPAPLPLRFFSYLLNRLSLDFNGVRFDSNTTPRGFHREDDGALDWDHVGSVQNHTWTGVQLNNR